MLKELIFLLIAAGNILIPKRRQLLLHSFPDVEDQLVAIVRWQRDHPNDRYPIVFLVSGDEKEARRRLRGLVGEYSLEIHIIKKTKLAAIWSYWRSRYVFFTHGLYGFLPGPKRQCIINLWHGMPLKRVWSGLPGSHVPHCTWLLSTSRMFSEVQAAAAGFSVQKVISSGLPRNDLLFSRSEAAACFEVNVREGVEKVILFLPTYRQSRTGFITDDGVETASALAMAETEVAQLCKILWTTRTRILVKPHPMSVHYGCEQKLDERLWIISDHWLHDQGVTLYEALGRMDALITDISSVYVDYLSLRRPVFFYFPDIDKYRQTRQFSIEPIEKWLAGPLCGTAEQLFEKLKDYTEGRDEYQALRERLAEKLNPQTIPDATGKLFQFLNIEAQ